MLELNYIYFERLTDGATLPSRAHAFDAGLDIYCVDDLLFAPQELLLVGTGISVRIPAGFEGQLRSRSGLALKKGLVVHQGVGTIDSGYEGEIKVMLRNTFSHPVTIDKGDRIAQLIIAEVALPKPQWASETMSTNYALPGVDWSLIGDVPTGTSRGAGGFGSTGN